MRHGFGFIAYVLLLLLRGRVREINPILVIVALLFMVSFWLG